MAIIEAISGGGRKVNGVKLTKVQFEAWQAAGSPNSKKDIKAIKAGTFTGSVSTPTPTSGSGIPTPTSTAPSSSGNLIGGEPTKSPQIGGQRYELRSGVWYLAGTNTFGTNQEHLDKLIGAFGGEVGAPGNEVTAPGEKGEEFGTPGEGTFEDYDDTALRATPEFNALSEEDQESVLAVFAVIAGNDKTQADRLAKAFQVASKINDPVFSQQLRLAVDAIERGFVSIDNEAEFAEQQLQSRLSDLREDFERNKSFFTLEQITAMKEIDRAFAQNLDVLQTNLAATGFTSSSRRTKKEGFLSDATGDLRESTSRKFEFQLDQNRASLDRGERNTSSELARLKQLTEEGKLDFLRGGEAEVGTENLPSLPGAPDPLGDIFGKIPADKLQSTINAATSFVF